MDISHKISDRIVWIATVIYLGKIYINFNLSIYSLYRYLRRQHEV